MGPHLSAAPAPFGFSDVVFLSHVLTGSTPVFPGDPPVGLRPAATIEHDGYYLQQVSFGEQSGTHWAAAAHFSDLAVHRPALGSAALAVTTRHGLGRVEARLREMLDNNPNSTVSLMSPIELARLGRRMGVISEPTLSAVEGLFVLRNLAAHSPAEALSVNEAKDFHALADAVLYALRAKDGT